MGVAGIELSEKLNSLINYLFFDILSYNILIVSFTIIANYNIDFHVTFINLLNFSILQDQGPHIYQTCPSANFFDCRAMAIGARSQSARTYLEKHLNTFMDCDLQDLVAHGLRALRDTLPNEVDLNTKVWLKILPTVTSTDGGLCL